MNINTILDAIIQHIESTNEFLEVKSHSGVFDEKDLKRFSVKSPAARVAWAKTTKLGQTGSGQFMERCSFGVYLVARPKPKLPAEREIIRLSDIVVELIEGNQWGLNEVQPASYKERLLLDVHDGICLGGIVFEQEILTGKNLYAEDIKDDFGFGASSVEEVLAKNPQWGEYSSNEDVE